jgi:glycosyltransferase involved in cell wall biosynthesis
LFLSRWFPYPPDNGSKIRISNLLEVLARNYEVTLISFYEAAENLSEEELAAFSVPGIHVRAVPYRPFHPGSRTAIRGFLSMRPRSFVDTENPAMRRAIDDELAHGVFDVVVASQLDMIPYALEIPATPALLEEIELGRYCERSLATPAGAREWMTRVKLRHYLRQSLSRFSACTVVSEVERQHLRRLVGGHPPTVVIPNAIDRAAYVGDFGSPEPKTLVWCGSMNYAPNYEAVKYYLDHIHPRVAEAVPGVRLRITGRLDQVDVRPFQAMPGVEIVGHVPDVRPMIARSWASIVPIRSGGGTRLKILESMALGSPVVSTTKGAEGLEVVDGENILLADSPEGFARRAIEILHSPALRGRIRSGALNLVSSRYDWQILAPSVADLVEQVRTSVVA